MVGTIRVKVCVHFKARNRHLAAAGSEKRACGNLSSSLYRTITDPLSYRHKDDQTNALLIAIGNTRMDSSIPFVLSVLRAHATGTIDIASTR